MAYFEVFVEPDGTDNAVLIDSDNWMIPPTPAGGGGRPLDMFVWNGSDTPVDVYLLASHQDLVFVKDPDHYSDAQTEEQYRSIVTRSGSGFPDSISINGLGPGSFFPFRIANSSVSATYSWLDANSCTMSTAGHGSNIFNGQRIYVIGHHA